MRKYAILLFVALLCHRMGPVAHAAEILPGSPRQVVGTVKDALGRPLPAVHLRLESSDGHVIARTDSDADGRFSFTGVNPGTYAVVADKSQFKTATAVATLAPGAGAEVTLAMESEEALNLEVVAKRLDRARNELSPQTGGSVYHFTEQSITDLPQGQNTSLNQVILQAPGVVQDSFGQLHVRADHGDLQYRINGVQLPEGISGFGQALNPRFASKIDLLTGALPAQYGYRTAGVVDIQTKSGAFAPGGSMELYGGQVGTFQPSFELGGSRGPFNYYLTGFYLQNDRGIEPPTPGPSAVHDHTTQGQAFGYFSYILNPSLRLSLLAGTAVNHFEIPASRGLDPVYTLAGVPDFPSINVAENQREQNHYGVLALQGAEGLNLDYQIAFFTRYSTIFFSPDPAGDLIYNGIASKVFRSSFVNGLQGDASYRLTDTHTLRTGFYFSGESVHIANHSQVFPADEMGNQSSDMPFGVVDNLTATAWQYGLYLQDEWRPLAKLTINYGARLDGFDAFGHTGQLSPRFGLVYQLLEGTTLHAGYARYFTPPPAELISTTSISKFQHTTNAAAIPLSSPVQPDRSHYFDAGITQQIGPAITVGIDGYYRLARPVLDEGQFGRALVFSPFNYRKGQLYGVEFTSSYTRENLSAYFTFTYSKALGKQVASGEFNFDPDEFAFINTHYVHLDHDQTLTSSMGLAYRWGGFNFLFNYVYGSGLRSGFANTDSLPSYLQANVGVTRGFDVPGVGIVQARLSVINLFDETYLIRDGGGIGVQAAQFGPRRAFFFGIKVPLFGTVPTTVAAP